MTYVDGFVAGMAIPALSWLQLGTRTLPRPLAWLGVLAGGYYLVSEPIQLAISRSPAGPTQPVGVVLVVIGVLAVAAVLAVRPGHGTQARSAVPVSVPTP